jgi:hypothetical protein
MNEDKFAGPVFIIGMPRSGKKLLRDLLNQNSRIGIPIHETGFIPHMADRFGNPPKFDDQHEFHKFYEEFIQDPFFQQFKRKGRVLSKEDLDKAADKTSWHSILECILRFYAPDGRAEDFIWGDKSPHYLTYMPLLKEMLPKARFIHCIRDPRDYCLSHKKVWGKSIYRAAESWRQRMEAALADSHQLGTDYMEVFYESLLEDPRKTLSNICEFLDCEFISSMTELSRSPETLGDTRGQVRIVRDNRNKYLTQLTPSQVMRIEEIVCPVARVVGYELDDVKFKPVEPQMLKVLTLYDAWTSLRFHVHQYGLRQGLYRLYHWHSRGSWVAPYLELIRYTIRIVRKKAFG